MLHIRFMRGFDRRTRPYNIEEHGGLRNITTKRKGDEQYSELRGTTHCLNFQFYGCFWAHHQPESKRPSVKGECENAESIRDQELEG